MSYNVDELCFYERGVDGQLIPLHPWNKLKKGKPRGKTPIHYEWTTKDYKEDPSSWADDGYNIGYRIPEGEIIIDLDPRNYDLDIDTEQQVASYMGYESFEDLCWELPVIQTGSGGYHIYCKLPKDYNYKLLRGAVKVLPGMDIKKKGGYVVATGSKHPNGEYYSALCLDPMQEIPEQMLNLISREKLVDKDYKSGYGAFNGSQLQDLILDKLDVHEYDTNDTWEPLMMACHHATAGEGIEEFLDWCSGDMSFEDQDASVRTRWDSLDDSKDVQRTAASLIRELKNKGEDIIAAKATLDFGNTIEPDQFDDEDTEEARMLADARDAANRIDVSDIMEVPKGVGGVDGAALEYAKSLSKQANMEDKMKCIRLIKAASLEESIEAQEALMANKVMSQSAINKRLKALDAKILDSVTEILSNTTINTVFKSGKHIVTEPNRQIWAFNRTHWKPMPDDYLGKMIYGVLDTLKRKMDVEANEVTLVTNAVKAVRMRSSLLTSRLFSPDEAYRPVINCNNGEIWINRDGTHQLKPHSYRSYQLRCLKVDYDPSAECPLFLDTMKGIFELYKDGDEIIRHLGEVMGYIIQPYKPEANWWMFRGPGGDGKSTILKVISAILGEAYKPADQKLLSNSSGMGNNHANHGLVGKLAVVIEELKKGTALNDSGLKMLSENTRMTANPKIKDEYDFNYIGSLIMCCNFYPVINDTSEGTLRRANVIPFNRQFVKNGNDDSNRASSIVDSPEELAGVLNFMLEGYQRYKDRGGFLPPESCVVAKEEWLCQANNVVRFVKENVTPTDPDDKMELASLVYKRYERWCDLSGIKAKGRNNFYMDLDNLGYKKKESSGNKLYLFGGKLLEEEIEDFENLDEWG